MPMMPTVSIGRTSDGRVGIIGTRTYTDIAVWCRDAETASRHTPLQLFVDGRRTTVRRAMCGPLVTGYLTVDERVTQLCIGFDQLRKDPT